MSFNLFDAMAGLLLVATVTAAAMQVDQSANVQNDDSIGQRLIASPRDLAAKKTEDAKAKAKADPKVKPKFERITFNFPIVRGQGARLIASSDGSCEFALMSVEPENKTVRKRYGRKGKLDSSADFNKLVAATDYLQNGKVNDAIPGGYGSDCDITIRQSAKDHTLKLQLYNQGGPYDELMRFVHGLVNKNFDQMPTIPWERYTKKRLEDSVADNKPVLQFFYSEVVAHELGRYGPQLPEAISLIKKHGVICLNGSRKFIGFHRSTDPKSPDYISPGQDGLSLYLPKTKHTIYITNRRAVSVLAALKRAFGVLTDGKVDVGGQDFMLIAPAEAKTIGELNFKIHTESDWVLPSKPGERVALPIKLGISGGKPYFPRAGTYSPILETPDGKKLVLEPKLSDRPIDDIRTGRHSIGIYVWTYFEKDKATGETYFVFMQHGREHTSRVGPIKPGTYKLSISLRPCPLKRDVEDLPAGLWSGQGTTSSVAVTIHDPAKAIRPRTVDGWSP